MGILSWALLPVVALAAAGAAPNAELGLDAALERVLNESPRIEAADLAIAAARERTLQAGRRPNPQLELEWENLAGTGAFSGLDAAELTLSAVQTFELGGKRSGRVAAAQAARALTEFDRVELRLDLAAATRAAFLAAWSAQESARLAVEQLALDRQLLAELGKRHEAGAASPIDLNRARVIVARSGIESAAAARKAETARRRLATLWGAGAPDFACVENRFEPVPDPTDLPPGIDWREHNPALARRRAERAAFAAERALAGALARPDLELGAGLRREHATGDAALVVAVGLPVPLFDRNRAQQRVWTHEIERSERLAEADALAVAADLEVARAERQSAYEEIVALRDEILPQAAAAHESTREGHLRGLFSLTDVLETRRTLLDLHRTRLDAVARYHQAQIRIDRLTGRSPFPAAEPQEDNR